MRFFSKKPFLHLLAFTSIIPIPLVLSCNVRVKREIKDSELDIKKWQSRDWKQLRKMIQSKFKQAVVKDMFSNYFYHNTNPTTEKNELLEPSQLTKAATREEMDRIFLERKKRIGNYATGILANVFLRISSNKLVPKKYKFLLNQIKTTYNRTTNIYPTKIFPKIIDDDKYLHIEFRADLLTSMKRRFVRKFLDLSFNFPIFDGQYSQTNLRKFYKITELDDPNKLARQIKTSGQMENIWLSTITNDIGIKAPGNGLIDYYNAKDLLGNKQLLNLNSGFYPLDNDKNDLYVPQFTGDITNPLAPKTYSFANRYGKILNQPSTNEEGKVLYTSQEKHHAFITLKSTDKVAKLESAIQSKWFTNSQMPLFKALFASKGDWTIKVEAQTWAGNPASNYTIADWVENIGHRGKFFFYMISKYDNTESYYYEIGNGMANVKEVV